jgi:leucyl/phenylalanyl-tRNA---protein transferase
MPVRQFPDWDSFEIAAEASDSPVAFGADLSPASVLGAYRRGIIPFPAPDDHFRTINEFRYEDQVAGGTIGLVGPELAGAETGGAGRWGDDPYWVAWWSPDPRPVLSVDQVHLGRNVRKQLRRGGEYTTANTMFGQVAEECRAGREPRWLTDPLLRSLIELHREGWAHSIEVWLDGDLIGGAMGIGIGRTISGDSLFSRRPGAARIAVADMAARLGAAGGLLIDAQWDSPFLRSLGATPMPRERYLPLLGLSAERIALPGQPLPARRLGAADHSP